MATEARIFSIDGIPVGNLVENSHGIIGTYKERYTITRIKEFQGIFPGMKILAPNYTDSIERNYLMIFAGTILKKIRFIRQRKQAAGKYENKVLYAAELVEDQMGAILFYECSPAYQAIGAFIQLDPVSPVEFEIIVRECWSLEELNEFT